MMRTFSPAQRMSLGHHADVAQAVTRVLDAPAPAHRVYNVVDDEAPDLATLFASVGAGNGDEPAAAAVASGREAYASGITATDDSALCERLGLPVIVVQGSERAMKVTTAEDFARVEAVYHLPE